jgi:hypothetical protein
LIVTELLQDLKFADTIRAIFDFGNIGEEVLEFLNAWEYESVCTWIASVGLPFFTSGEELCLNRSKSWRSWADLIADSDFASFFSSFLRFALGS